MIRYMRASIDVKLDPIEAGAIGATLANTEVLRSHFTVALSKQI